MMSNLTRCTLLIMLLLSFSIGVYYLDDVPTFIKHSVSITCIGLSQIYLLSLINTKESILLIILKFIGNLLGILK